MSDGRPVSAPFYSKDQLDYLGEQHAEAFSRLDGKANPGFSAWKFAVYYMGKEVRFEWLSNNGSVLGLSSFTAGTRVPIYVPEENGVEWQELGPDTILLSKLFEDALFSSNMMLQNIGSAFRASLLAMARQGIFFIPAILILPRLFGLFGLQIVQPVADVCAFLLTIPLVKPVLRELKQNDAAEDTGNGQ